MAGTRRRNRRAQNDHETTRPRTAWSRSNTAVIRNPERTKKTSTPRNPPGRTPDAWFRPMLSWNKSTAMIANARNPSRAGS